MRMVLALVLFWLVGCADNAAPLVHGHAHNDYQHARPLVEALECGFCSIEADIHLVDGKLLVAHDKEDVRANRTLESLYLDPLRQRVENTFQHSGIRSLEFT